MNDRMKLIQAPSQQVYICAPSAAIVEFHEGKYHLKKSFKKAMAALHIAAPQHYYVSPSMFFDYLEFMGRGGDWDTWKEPCEVAMRHSDSAYVLTFHGWQNSKGVTGEIDFFTTTSRSRPILYDPDVDQLVLEYSE